MYAEEACFQAVRSKNGGGRHTCTCPPPSSLPSPISVVLVYSSSQSIQLRFRVQYHESHISHHSLTQHKNPPLKSPHFPRQMLSFTNTIVYPTKKEQGKYNPSPSIHSPILPLPTLHVFIPNAVVKQKKDKRQTNMNMYVHATN
jgi:hypothetical protein